jgi:hypothetical protein
MESTASGVPDGPGPAFSARRVRLAILSQCAPLLCVASAMADAVARPWYPAGGPPWLLQVVSSTALLAGSGYAVLGRRARFWCTALLGACSFWTLQIPNSTAHIAAALFLLALVAITTGDLLRLRPGGKVAGLLPVVAEMFGTIMVCAFAAWFVMFVAALMFSIGACVTTGENPIGNCDPLVIVVPLVTGLR